MDDILLIGLVLAAGARLHRLRRALRAPRPMSLIDVVAAVVAVGCSCTSSWRCFAPRSSDGGRHRSGSPRDASSLLVVVGLLPCRSAATSRASSPGSAPSCRRCSPRSSAASTACSASIPSASSDGRRTRSPSSSSPLRRSSGSTACSASRALLPLNPAGFEGVAPDLAFNTAISFVTNTNWQAYSGESTMSHVTQVAGLAVQNFVSAATGIAVAIALTRGLARRSQATIGNFWVDLTRSTLYILLPIAFVAAIVLVSQGVIQTWSGPSTVTTLQGAEQTIAVGPHRRPRGDQGARHERRRAVQCQLRASLREPERIHELVRDRPPARHPVRPDHHVWAPGRRCAPGMGPVRRDDVGPRRRHRRRRPSSSSAATRCSRRRSCRPPATWRARRPASARS